MKTTVLIGGGSGLVGQRIIDLLPQAKYNIKVLSRSRRDDRDNVNYIHWDIKNGVIDERALDEVDYIINLTGAGIADRKWTDDRKKAIIDSRVDSTRLLIEQLKSKKHSVKAFISASAIGYYGDSGDRILTENSGPGDEFLSSTCEAWEDAVVEVQPYVDREVRLRIGIVLSTLGGALPKVLMTSSFGLYNYFGNGSQYYSWIHIDDLAHMFIHAMENDKMNGAYNAVAPEPLTNKMFTQQVKESVGGFGLVLPAPAIALRLILGEMSDVVLNSNRVIPERLNKLDYNFKYTDLKAAIKDLRQRTI